MTKKQRIERVVAVCSALVAVGVVYAVLCTYTSFSLPCVFRLITGLKCPGCGVTHMCLCLLKFDFKEAYLSNRAVFLMLPVGAFLTGDMILRYIRYGTKTFGKAERVVTYILLFILLAFSIFRNIFDW